MKVKFSLQQYRASNAYKYIILIVIRFNDSYLICFNVHDTLSIVYHNRLTIGYKGVFISR